MTPSPKVRESRMSAVPITPRLLTDKQAAGPSDAKPPPSPAVLAAARAIARLMAAEQDHPRN